MRGWFGYAPLTTRQFSPGINIDFWVIGLQILGVSSLAAAFNFITTIINLRAPGMTLMRMPMFTWMSFVVQFLIILAFPVITIALVFLLFDRFFGTQFYEIAAGADPLLWQHLFWIFGHPEVYILILPAFGLVSEIIPTFSKKPLFGYPVMVYSGMLIGLLGFGVWAHHMFAVGMGPIGDSVFSLATMLIGIPTGVKIFNWIGTMAQGHLRFTTPMLFAIGLVALFTIGGISGVMHSSPPADLQQTDSYFIVAHFHYVLFGGSIMGIFGGIYHYFPKMTGRLMNDKLGKVHFWLNFIAMNLTFFPMHFSGMLGMPRRIYTYDSGQGWDTFNLISSIGAYMLVVSTSIFVYNFFRSRKHGEIASANPWDAGTLEWTIPSPAPEYNFATLPQVTSRYPLWEGNEKDLESARINSQEGKTAEELHIVLPYPTIKPMIVAGSMVLMFCGLITSKAVLFVGAALMVVHTLQLAPEPARAGAPLNHVSTSRSLHVDRTRLQKDCDLGLHRLGVHALRVAHLDVSHLQGKKHRRSVPARGMGQSSGEHFKAILNIPVTSASTFVLLMSSLFMVLALAAVQNKNVPKRTRGERILGSSKLWLWATAIAGTTFLGFQAFEFTSFVHEGLTIKTNLFGSSFFTLTGFHGAHVTAGVIWLLTLLAIDYRRGLGPPTRSTSTSPRCTGTSSTSSGLRSSLWFT